VGEGRGVGYDPVKLAEGLKGVVCRGLERKYYRFRGGRWYGGIATADCVGCNLRCVFCWGWQVRDNPAKAGFWCTPDEVAGKLAGIARRRGYTQVRISGNEPTLCREHLLAVLDRLEGSGLAFILETNGILIGHDPSYARDLSKYDFVHVRVSLKGASPEEFARLTGARPEAFELQLKALENLLDYGVSAHPAVMLSFSEPSSVEVSGDRSQVVGGVRGGVRIPVPPRCQAAEESRGVASRRLQPRQHPPRANLARGKKRSSRLASRACPLSSRAPAARRRCRTSRRPSRGSPACAP
jgi:uncharacterized Fe-S cluster-containing radical SAM superfamily protein